MGKIIFFEEDHEKKCAFRFVSGFKKRRWFRGARIEYSSDLTNCAECDFKDEDFEDIEARVKRDYPNAVVNIINFHDFIEKYDLQHFFVICKWNKKEEDKEFYQGKDAGGKAMYSADIEDASIMLSCEFAEQTLRTIQQVACDKVYVLSIVLNNLTNELRKPVMMITCTSKKSGQTKYFKKLDGRRLRLVSTSEAATKLTYDTSVATWEYLKTHNKNFLYAVLPVFKDNVNCKDIERYMKENNVSRNICMDFQLKHLNRQRG